LRIKTFSGAARKTLRGGTSVFLRSRVVTGNRDSNSVKE